MTLVNLYDIKQYQFERFKLINRPLTFWERWNAFLTKMDYFYLCFIDFINCFWLLFYTKRRKQNRTSIRSWKKDQWFSFGWSKKIASLKETNLMKQRECKRPNGMIIITTIHLSTKHTLSFRLHVNCSNMIIHDIIC